MEQEILEFFFPASGGWRKWLAPKLETSLVVCWMLDAVVFFEDSTFDRRISDTLTLVKKQTVAAVFVFLLLPGID